MTALYVAAFGILGVMARFGVNQLTFRLWQPLFPFHTLAINLSGSFAIGIVYVLAAERGAISETWRLAWMVGFLGGFTTFSAYSLECVQLWTNGRPAFALLYGTLSPTLGILAAIAGMTLARR